ncbi:FERM, ARHGEF and pleckstrin domain-containing protein 2 isoform X3 [Pteropus alecto]|uniref:FERM, ARHGEF and pleckstrin domain-containing protein 2 isoform X3 n=1 Tax=Pteropus alecto TaxID=9402 RepID=UPI000D535EB5|nr:FERM, ARHGEF and pleckstrin domain-containing protein 2 isoform X3 [Pteropus alecto]
MGEIEGTYRVLQTPGTRLGAQTAGGVSTLEPLQTLRAVTGTSARMQEKHLHIRVKLLDNTVEMFDIEPKCDGQILLTQVWKRLNLIECDYFGLEFQNAPSCWIWLEPMKPIIRQVRKPKNAVLRLAVKFFPPDPGQLQEEYTRYLFALQLKRDLLEERLTCTDATAALLVSHLLQSEIGDYDESLDREHLKANEYLPRQAPSLEKILEFHRTHTGQTPAESDFQVLDIARKLEMYGIRLHQASDREGAKISLAVSHTGVLVFQSTAKINTFNWSRVRKLSFKRKRFLIKLHPEVHGPYQDTLEFLLGSRDECKNFWKICVEYHTFFRLFDQPKPKAKAVFFSRGSSFRYSGRTQKQLVDHVKDGGMRRVPYERRHSRTQMSARALTTDLPKQSVSFTEGVTTAVSPSSADASVYSAPPSPLAPASPPSFEDSGSSPTEPQAPRFQRPAAERGGRALEGLDTGQAPPRGHPALQPRQGLSVDSPQPSPSARKSPLSLSPAFQVALGPAERGSSPLLSPVLSDAGQARTDDEEEPKHKWPGADEAYFIAKEILATERTYLKDLEVITVWFRSAAVQEDALPAGLSSLLFSSIDPIYELHSGFLRELEQRLALWERPSGATGSRQRIGDVLLRNMRQLKQFTGHFQRHDEVLMELEKAAKRVKKLEAVYKEFELQKVCYLPLSSFLLKPTQRLLHYRRLLGRLCGHYAPGHPDFADCREWWPASPAPTPGACTEGPLHTDALTVITEMTAMLRHSLVRLENLQKLTELQRDLVGVESLIAPGREFIREGCLHKLTKKGLQQRMFFLFSDMLLYTSRGVSGTSRFRTRGLLPLRGMLLIVLDPPVSSRVPCGPPPARLGGRRRGVGTLRASRSPRSQRRLGQRRAPAPLRSASPATLYTPTPACPQVEASEDARSVPHCFTIYAAPKTIVVAASSQLEKEKWMQDLDSAIEAAKGGGATPLELPGSVVCTPPRRSSDEVPLEQELAHAHSTRSPPEGQSTLRANSTAHVCWCRSTSVSRADHSAAVENQLSGYLLRKFKNSNGWQKLWVVFTNFCLFFYKTHQDDHPLASLPLLGYRVSVPQEADGILKEHVFKLQFKSHVYFFRAESKYTFGRWMEVIESASSSPGRAGPPEEEA